MRGMERGSDCETRIAGIRKNPVFFKPGLVPDPLIELHVEEDATGTGKPLDLLSFCPMPHDVQHLPLKNRLCAGSDVLRATILYDLANARSIRKMPVMRTVLVQIGPIAEYMGSRELSLGVRGMEKRH